MSIIEQLNKRAGSKCELCQNNDNLQAYRVPPVSKDGIDGQCLVCYTCLEQIEDPEKVDINHWRCLNDTIWSQYPAVQVMAWRMLTRISAEGWPLDLLGQMYMEEENLAWAKATGEGLEDPVGPVHRDVNGVILEAGDSVVLIKDLKVKGSSMVAKQGTAVRRISLDHNNEEYIEGRVDGQQIVIITKYVKKI